MLLLCDKKGEVMENCNGKTGLNWLWLKYFPFANYNIV
jgi:hypothetical protein